MLLNTVDTALTIYFMQSEDVCGGIGADDCEKVKVVMRMSEIPTLGKTGSWLSCVEVCENS